MLSLSIAGLSVDFAYADVRFFEKRLSKYTGPSAVQPDLLLSTTLKDPLIPPEGAIVKTIDQVRIFRDSDGRLCRCRDYDGELVLVKVSTEDYSRTDLLLSPKLTGTGFTLADYEYVNTGGAFADRLLVLGGAVLHGSAVAIDGQGIVFSANSGIGKSTHTALWASQFGSRVVIVNDDKPAIRFVAGHPMVCGTPWSGKSDLNENMSVPLRAIVFLDRGKENRIRRMGTRDSIFRLMSQIYRAYYDENLGLLTTGIIERLVKGVPIYLLQCNISTEAVEFVYRYLISEGVITQ